MLASTITFLTLATAAAASPYVPMMAARAPAGTATGPTAGRPTSIQLQFSSFHESNSCDGSNITQTYPAGQCIQLPVAARSWKSWADVSTTQVQMAVYHNAKCQPPGMVEHLDAGSACMTMGGLAGSSSNSTARSIMINL